MQKRGSTLHGFLKEVNEVSAFPELSFGRIPA